MEKYFKASPLTFGISVICIILASMTTLIFKKDSEVLLASSVFMIYPITVFVINFALMIKKLLFSKKN
jgi:uncharacterized membrane protein YhaH (DUF805 family)